MQPLSDYHIRAYIVLTSIVLLLIIILSSYIYVTIKKRKLQRKIEKLIDDANKEADAISSVKCELGLLNSPTHIENYNRIKRLYFLFGAFLGVALIYYLLKRKR